MGINIDLIKLTDVIDGVEMIYRPTVIWDDKDVVLIDTGYPGHYQDIQNSLQEKSIGKITKIIITHHDHDHLGSLYELVEGYDHKIEVYSHELTKPYIEGEEPLIKLKFKVPKVVVNKTITDGEVLPFCGGIQVIFTPGHTPDHTSLYHQPSKTLITGDALSAQNGKLCPPVAKFTLNMEGALQSARKFFEYEIDRVSCFHGGIVVDEIKESLEKIVEGSFTRG